MECDIVILSEPGPNPTGSSWAVLRTQLIPARGRKLSEEKEGLTVSGDTTYPREGTETQRIHRFDVKEEDTTYPREGTETRWSMTPSM